MRGQAEGYAPLKPQRCPGVRTDGQPCQANIVFPENGYCIAHSPLPAHRLLSLESKILGGDKLREKVGKAPAKDPGAADPAFRTLTDLLSYYEWVAGEHRRGNMSDGEVFAAVAPASKSWEVLSGDRRLRALERGPSSPVVAVEIDPVSGVMRVIAGHRQAELDEGDDA
jgi:hypothetical protein